MSAEIYQLEEDCELCLDLLQEDSGDDSDVENQCTVLLRCLHIFHLACLEDFKAKRNQCPICKIEIKPFQTFLYGQDKHLEARSNLFRDLFKELFELESATRNQVCTETETSWDQLRQLEVKERVIDRRNDFVSKYSPSQSTPPIFDFNDKEWIAPFIRYVQTEENESRFSSKMTNGYYKLGNRIPLFALTGVECHVYKQSIESSSDRITFKIRGDSCNSNQLLNMKQLSKELDLELVRYSTHDDDKQDDDKRDTSSYIKINSHPNVNYFQYVGRETQLIHYFDPEVYQSHACRADFLFEIKYYVRSHYGGYERGPILSAKQVRIVTPIEKRVFLTDLLKCK